MSQVRKHPIPRGTALHAYAQKPGFYTDCFAADTAGQVTFADYIEAFYTTPLFKAERLVLRVFAGLRTTDDEARQLAMGKIDRFAAWQAAERSDTELFMRTPGRTSSWFMCETTGTPQAPQTRLLFGSVVAPMPSAGSEEPKMGLLFSSALGPHRVYSRLLLAAAARAGLLNCELRVGQGCDIGRIRRGLQSARLEHAGG